MDDQLDLFEKEEGQENGDAYSYKSMGFIYPDKKEKPETTEFFDVPPHYDIDISVKFWHDKICPECGAGTKETGASESRWAVYYECPGCELRFIQDAWAQGQEPFLYKDDGPKEIL